jgi:hypothetical protein
VTEVAISPQSVNATETEKFQPDEPFSAQMTAAFLAQPFHRLMHQISRYQERNAKSLI